MVAMGATYRVRPPRHTGPVRGDPGRRLQWAFRRARARAARVWRRAAPARRSPPAAPAHHGRSTSSSTAPATRARRPRPRRRPASTLPPVATSGPLQAGSPIALPFSADRVTAAESPDGAVFAAPQDPTNPAPAVAWVVDGNGPAAVAEHVANGIAALAADGTNFYVATYSDVFAYQPRQRQPGRAVDDADGERGQQLRRRPRRARRGRRLRAASSVTQGNTVSVYRINPTSSAGPRLVVQGLGDAIGPDGSIYYESDGHQLVAVRRPTGPRSPGPALARHAQRPRGRRPVPRCGRRRARCGSASRPARASMRSSPPTTPPPSPRWRRTAARSPAPSSTRRRARSCSNRAGRTATCPHASPADAVVVRPAHRRPRRRQRRGRRGRRRHAARPGARGRHVRHDDRPVRPRPAVVAHSGSAGLLLVPSGA